MLFETAILVDVEAPLGEALRFVEHPERSAVARVALEAGVGRVMAAAAPDVTTELPFCCCTPVTVATALQRFRVPLLRLRELDLQLRRPLETQSIISFGMNTKIVPNISS
jgi:hypothetical protein